MAKILIVGCGAIGYALAQALAKSGHCVTGLKRSPLTSDNDKLAFVSADIAKQPDLKSLDLDFDVIYFIVSADKRDAASYVQVYETGLANLIEHFAKAMVQPKWIFVSSTSVYGQNRGEWVDETSETVPISETARYIVAAEQTLWALNPGNVSVRFSGIYGPGREYLLRMVRQNPIIQKQPPTYTNRIHQADCIGILLFLFEKHLRGVSLQPCYLASDDNPAPLWEVISWLAEQMRCNTPSEKTGDEAYGQNKRCCNTRVKALGYQFVYPDYKAGYQELMDNKGIG